MRALALLTVVVLASCQAPAPAPAEQPAPAEPTAAPDASPPVPRSGSQESAQATATHWQCDELLLDAKFAASSVDLRFSGRSVSLPQATSGSGARYADAAGNEFWNKGRQATLALAGDPARQCAITERISPWIEAATRGVVFRAMGGEPGWTVEVSGDEHPTLHAELDYGERKLDATNLRGAGGGWTGTASDGSTVTVDVTRAACSDGMSGERFEAKVALRAGDAKYTGCGAYLDD